MPFFTASLFIVVSENKNSAVVGRKFPKTHLRNL
jgi:hypothetical protein